MAGAAPAAGARVTPVGAQPSDECERCGSTELWWRNCKLICRNCHTIVKSCADL